MSTKRTASLEPAWAAEIGDYVNALAWSPDQTLLAAAAISGPVYLFDTTNGSGLLELPGHVMGTETLAWHPSGELLASGGQDGKVRIWDLEGEARTLPAGKGWVMRVAWRPDGSMLAVAVGKRVLLVAPDGAQIRDLGEHSGIVYDMAWGPDGETLAAVAYGITTLHVVGSDAAPRNFQWKGSSLVLAWSPDGKYIATGDQDSTVHFWVVKTGKDLQMYGYQTKVRELAWDPTARYLATGGGEQIVVWDCAGKGPEGSKPTMLQGHESFISTLQFQKTGTLLASGGLDSKVILWDFPASKRAKAEQSLSAAVSTVTWSPDDSMIAAGSAAGDVAVFRAS